MVGIFTIPSGLFLGAKGKGDVGVDSVMI